MEENGKGIPPRRGETGQEAPVPPHERLRNLSYSEQLKVAREDLGKVIGKQGRTARSIRTILASAGMKLRKRIVFEIIE